MLRADAAIATDDDRRPTDDDRRRPTTTECNIVLSGERQWIPLFLVVSFLLDAPHPLIFFAVRAVSRSSQPRARTHARSSSVLSAGDRRRFCVPVGAAASKSRRAIKSLAGSDQANDQSTGGLDCVPTHPRAHGGE